MNVYALQCLMVQHAHFIDMQRSNLPRRGYSAALSWVIPGNDVFTLTFWTCAHNHHYSDTALRCAQRRLISVQHAHPLPGRLPAAKSSGRNTTAAGRIVIPSRPVSAGRIKTSGLRPTSNFDIHQSDVSLNCHI